MLNKLSHNKRSVCSEEVQEQSEWNFDLGVGEGVDLHICVIIDFQKRSKLNSQLLNSDKVLRTPVKFAHCNIGTEDHPDAGINLSNAEDKSNQSYSQIVSCFKQPTEDYLHQPSKSQKEVQTNNVKAAGQKIHDI